MQGGHYIYACSLSWVHAILQDDQDEESRYIGANRKYSMLGGMALEWLVSDDPAMYSSLFRLHGC